ncbi:MAG: DUF4407 domain-containing protein [Devosia sp.]|nr:DUF4407 domain-containing protein [Devosia sp.]
MEKYNPLPPERPSPILLFLWWLAGVDEETLSTCPQHDKDNVLAIALLMIGVWLYQTALFSIVLHRMLADDGAIHPELVLASAFIATMIAMIDSYMVMRSGWHLHGIGELKRGGLDISGGWGPQVRNGIFLALRILLSVGIAQLTAVFTALILFHPDIAAEIDRVNRQQNADLIANVQAQVDAEIQRTATAVDAQNQRVTALDGQLAGMRQGTVDPTANDSQIQAAQADLAKAEAEKSKRDAELVAAQTFAANEIAGIKADPGNSGKPGKGPVRAGAEERVKAATANDTAAAQAVTDARARLDDLQKRLASTAPDRAKLAQAQLPPLEAQARDETAQLNTLRAHLTELTTGRENAIRAGVDSAPNHVGYDSGLLGQLAGLRTVAQSPEIAFVIGLIDLTSFGLELAAVLAKVTSFIPTTYSALLARNAYMRTVDIVNGMEESLNEGPRNMDAESGEEFGPSEDGTDDDDENEDEEGPANDNRSSITGPFGFGHANGKGGDNQPPKRPRGRPRKKPLN